MYHSLIYVSRSLLVLPDQAGEIDRIVEGSIERNAALAVRGALIFTERHFAQLLEGPSAAIETLMDSIERDPRHERVTVIERRAIEGYRFPDWSLAYWGDAGYMDLQVARVMKKADALSRSEQTTDLFTLLHALARESHRQRGPIGRPSRK
jgi:hypothetical protein